MSSLDSISIFNAQITRSTPIETIISLLTDLRLKMNYQFYSTLTNDERGKVINYLWIRLHNMWRNGPRELKNPTAATVGIILVNLAPFYTDDLMKSLSYIISNYNSTSILYFSCFCYLSKFYSPKAVETITKKINIFNLISVRDASNLPKMTKELFGLPNQLLHSLIEHYFLLLNKDPDNNYILKAVNIIISQNPEFFADFIKEDTPLEIIAATFGDKLPILNERIVQSISNKALQAIQDLGTPVKKISASCRLLSSLIANNQVPSNIVHGIFTKETLQKNSLLEDILLLPIEPSVVISIYGSQNIKTDLINNDDQLFESNNFTDNSSAGFQSDANLDPSISAIFHSKNFNDVIENPEMSLLVDDGNSDSVPGALAKDISFIPPLPLPDYPANKKVTFCKSATILQNNSPDDLKIELKQSKSSDFSEISSSITQKAFDGSNEDSHSNLDSESNNDIPSFANSEILKVRSRRRNNHRLSLDIKSAEMLQTALHSALSKNDQSQTKSTYLLRLNPKYVSPLINYFKRYPEYQNELCNLILYSISLYKMKSIFSETSQMTEKDIESTSIKNDAIYSAIKAVSEYHMTYHYTLLNNILEKIFEMIDYNDDDENVLNYATDITLNVKILEMIGTLKADRLTKKIANKMFELIEKSSVSKVSILRKKAMKSFVSLSKLTSKDLFKFFFDIYIQKLDLFNEKEFQMRISFIAYTMRHVLSQIPLSFSSITNFLYEALTLNGSFHRNDMLNIFKILSVFAPTFDDHQLLTIFIQHAMNMIKQNYLNYTGNEIYSTDFKAPFFTNHYKIENTIFQIDADLISNPGIWHRKCLKCAHIAYSFLSNVPWDKFDLTTNDKQFLEQVILQLAPLLPKETSNFLLMLRDSKLITPFLNAKIIAILGKVSRRKDDMISFLPLYRFVCNKNEKYKQLNIDFLVDSLLNILPRLTDITHDQAVSIQLFLSEKQIDTKDYKEFQKILNNQTSPSEASNVNAQNDDEYDDEDSEMAESPEILSEKELASIIFSLTPLVYANLDVPPEFLQPFQIRNFCINSTSAIDEEQCNQLFQYAISNGTPRVLSHIIRYSQKMHYNINIEEYLDNPLLNSKRLFSYVFTSITYRKRGFQNLSERCQQYIKQFFPSGYISFVLNANDMQRSNAIRLMQFDPNYFINEFSQIETFTRKQLINLCIYIQNVQFSRESIYKFVIELLSKSSKSQSYININIVRRIMTVYITCYGTSIKRAPKQFYGIITCELGYPIPLDFNSPVIKKLTAADFTELGYAVNAISHFYECEELVQQMTALFTKHSPNYLILNSKNNPKGSIDHLAEYANIILPSIRYQIVFLASKYLKKNYEFNITSEFINNVMKFLDLFVPLPISGSGSSKIINDDTSNTFFYFATCALNHELSSSAQKTIYNFMFERMPFEVSSFSIGRYIGLFKSFTNQEHLRYDLYNDIFQRCSFLVDSRACIRAFFIDMYSSIAKQIGKQKIFCEKMIDFMKNKMSYESIDVIEIASVEIMKAVTNNEEANNVLNFELSDFFVFFIGVASIEKKNRSMVHDELQKRYKGTHLLALQMLKDPKFRIFSPLVAFISDDIEIPKKLKKYLRSIRDKIQRVYATDTYHEF